MEGGAVFGESESADEHAQSIGGIADDECPGAAAACSECDFNDTATEGTEDVDGAEFLVFESSVDELHGDGCNAREWEFGDACDEQWNQGGFSVEGGNRPGKGHAQEENEDAKACCEPECAVDFLIFKVVILEHGLSHAESCEGFQAD